LIDMPITGQQAHVWAGTVTADELAARAIESTHRQGRLTVDVCRKMLVVSIAVIHCFIPGGAGQLAILPLSEDETSARARGWCLSLLARNESKEQALQKIKSGSILANNNPRDDGPFRKTLGHQEDITTYNTNIPYLRVSGAAFSEMKRPS
jgi:hypothetical protein